MSKKAGKNPIATEETRQPKKKPVKASTAMPTKKVVKSRKTVEKRPGSKSETVEWDSLPEDESEYNLEVRKNNPEPTKRKNMIQNTKSNDAQWIQSQRMKESIENQWIQKIRATREPEPLQIRNVQNEITNGFDSEETRDGYDSDETVDENREIYPEELPNNNQPPPKKAKKKSTSEPSIDMVLKNSTMRDAQAEFWKFLRAKNISGEIQWPVSVIIEKNDSKKKKTDDFSYEVRGVLFEDEKGRRTLPRWRSEKQQQE